MKFNRLFVAVATSLAMFSMAAPTLAEDAAPAAAPRPVIPANAPPEIAIPENQLALDLSTGGRVIIQLRPDAAPAHVERIKMLTRQGFYNGLLFHRVIDGFMAQTGDPAGNGTGGSTMPDMTAEFNDLPHLRGTVSMARAEAENSANSQFFIMLMPRFTLDKHYTALGRVISGIEYVDAIQRGEPPANPSRIVQASIVADNIPIPPAAMLTEARPAAPSISAADLNAPINQ